MRKCRAWPSSALLLLSPHAAIFRYRQAPGEQGPPSLPARLAGRPRRLHRTRRSEEHTSELQSLMRISYAVFCLKKKTNIHIKDSNSEIRLNMKCKKTVQ